MIKAPFKIKEIFEHLPQRPPFLLIDRVLKLDPGKSITAIKNITANESFFAGHFPGHPIMPGVLIVEALGQTSTVLAFASKEEDVNSGALYYLAGIDKARFKRVVEPGDQLLLKVEVIKIRQSVWVVKGVASVDGELVCSTEIMSVKKEGK